jgi:AcrR family transcriptional regulator
VGTLAEINTRRGLPRGRGSLPRSVVADAQRELVLRAMTSAVADLGYANVRIADVVRRARVSRQSFYGLFADKEQCFLAAHAEGMELIVHHLGLWAADHADPDPRTQVRGALGAYLSLAAEEPEFALCMLVELPAIGPRGLDARLAAHGQIAALLRAWHESARREEPSWPAVSPARYAAAVGAVHDLVFEAVASGRAAQAPALADEAAGAVFSLLEIPPPE